MEQNITNLTNTEWTFDALPTTSQSWSSRNWDINFQSNGNSYTELSTDQGEGQYYEVRVYYNSTTVYNSYTSPQWLNTNYRTIVITGGDDVENSSLISFLQTYASLTSREITYYNSEMNSPEDAYSKTYFPSLPLVTDVPLDVLSYVRPAVNFDINTSTMTLVWPEGGETEELSIPATYAPLRWEIWENSAFVGNFEVGVEIAAGAFSYDLVANCYWSDPVLNYEESYFQMPNLTLDSSIEGFFYGWNYTDTNGEVHTYLPGEYFTAFSAIDIATGITFIPIIESGSFNFRSFDSNYIGFSLYSKDNTYIFHSVADLGIYRVSDGSRYTENLRPNFQDRTSTVQGGDGTYYFGTSFQNRQFSLSIAFDSMTEQKRKTLITQMCDKTPKWLIFDEEPYKKYLVVPQGTSSLKWICFNEGAARRTYKGEGTLTFVCYNPYAISRYKYLNDYTIENIQEWSHYFSIHPYEGYRRQEDFVQLNFLVENYGYFHTTQLGSNLTQYRYASLAEFMDPTVTIYEVDWGNKIEWQNQLVTLKTFDEVMNAEGEGYKIYNPGDLPMDSIIEFISDLSGDITVALNNSDNLVMEISKEKIQDIIGETSLSDVKFVIDNKQHLFYLKENGSSNILYYLNDAIVVGDFFKIAPSADVQSIIMTNAKNISAEFDFLYY